jgi:selenide, water dikinase
MRTLNRTAAESLRAVDGVHACTDITGFGLIGHATEMAAASGVTVGIRASDVPMFNGVLDLVRKNAPGGLANNQEYFEPGVDMSDEVSAEVQKLLYDPQTSGGLLVSLDQLQADLALQLLARAGVHAARIGAVSPRSDKVLVIR